MSVCLSCRRSDAADSCSWLEDSRVHTARAVSEIVGCPNYRFLLLACLESEISQPLVADE